MSNVKIVVDLGFGDGGKGTVTSFLCNNNKNPIVIRYNGSYQAGHTVYYNNKKHVFSSFGSGTLQNIPTFWSKFCAIFPTALYNEYLALNDLDVQPILYVDSFAPVATPFDLLANINHKDNVKHGSCGVGVGMCFKRHESYYRIHFLDLFNSKILKIKLDNVRNYYEKEGFIFDEQILNEKIKYWLHSIERLIDLDVISLERTRFPKEQFDSFIFEGAQGIMIGENTGFFPNVTRSETTSKNALALIKEYSLDEPDMYYVNRIYSTRHGTGAFPAEQYPIELINNKSETNVYGEYQKNFRTGALDLDLINYALLCDDYNLNENIQKILVLTCLDQIPNKSKIKYIQNDVCLEGSIEDIMNGIEIKLKNRIFSYSPIGVNMEFAD